MYWHCAGSVLAFYWHCVLHWHSTTLHSEYAGIFRHGTRTALLLHRYATATPLPLHCYSAATAPALMLYRSGSMPVGTTPTPTISKVQHMLNNGSHSALGRREQILEQRSQYFSAGRASGQKRRSYASNALDHVPCELIPVDLGAPAAKVGRSLAKHCRSRPELGQHWPILVPNSAFFGGRRG